mgnify:CR=1 FL=1
MHVNLPMGGWESTIARGDDRVGDTLVDRLVFVHDGAVDVDPAAVADVAARLIDGGKKPAKTTRKATASRPRSKAAAPGTPAACCECHAA